MKIYDFEGSILETPFTVTFMRLTKRIDLPQNLAMIWGKSPFWLKKDDMITIIPKTIVANIIHIIINSVRIILPSTMTHKFNKSATIEALKKLQVTK